MRAAGGRVVALARPLRVPAFRRLWAAQLVSEVGDWSARLVLSVLVYTGNGSVALTGLVTTVDEGSAGSRALALARPLRDQATAH